MTRKKGVKNSGVRKNGQKTGANADDSLKPWSEIALEMGVSTARVLQIKDRAFAKLRKLSLEDEEFRKLVVDVFGSHPLEV